MNWFGLLAIVSTLHVVSGNLQMYLLNAIRQYQTLIFCKLYILMFITTRTEYLIPAYLAGGLIKESVYGIR